MKFPKTALKLGVFAPRRVKNRRICANLSSKAHMLLCNQFSLESYLCPSKSSDFRSFGNQRPGINCKSPMGDVLFIYYSKT
jgi:hypothetical protein